MHLTIEDKQDLWEALDSALEDLRYYVKHGAYDDDDTLARDRIARWERLRDRAEAAMAEEDIDHESLSISEIMVVRQLRHRASDLDVAPPMPTIEEITKAVEMSYLNEGLDVIWDGVAEFVYDTFPQFREPGEDPS
jgi:hypothetical protein